MPSFFLQVYHDNTATNCKCPLGFYGDRCESKGELCGDIVCLNAGTCQQFDHDSRVACRCLEVGKFACMVVMGNTLVSWLAGCDNGKGCQDVSLVPGS